MSELLFPSESSPQSLKGKEELLLAEGFILSSMNMRLKTDFPNSAPYSSLAPQFSNEHTSFFHKRSASFDRGV